RGPSHRTGPGRPRVVRKAVAGWLAVLAFAVLAVAFVGVLNLSGVAGGWPYAISVPLIGVVYWPLAWWTLIWHGLERPRWRSPGRRLRQVPWMAIFWGYLMPCVAVFVIVIAAVDFGTTWPAAHGGGRPGTLVLRSESCRKAHCTWRGWFRSDDGTIVRESVMMRGAVPAGARAGDRVRAPGSGKRR